MRIDAYGQKNILNLKGIEIYLKTNQYPNGIKINA